LATILYVPNYKDEYQARYRYERSGAEYIQLYQEAREAIRNAPISIDSRPMSLGDLYPLLSRWQGEYGIEQFVIDYSLKFFF
jgi:hypothetical protein